MACVSSVHFQILHDGKEIDPIIPQRGLRQGDPLSPYLFIICAEALSSLIKSREAAGHIHDCQIARGDLSISHLFFANNNFIFFRANEAKSYIIRHILLVYGEASEQRVNWNKSSISFSHNVNPMQQDTICSIMKVQGIVDHDKYLGIPSLQGGSKKRAFEYLRPRLVHENFQLYPKFRI